MKEKGFSLSFEWIVLFFLGLLLLFFAVSIFGSNSISAVKNFFKENWKFSPLLGKEEINLLQKQVAEDFNRCARSPDDNCICDIKIAPFNPDYGLVFTNGEMYLQKFSDKSMAGVKSSINGAPCYLATVPKLKPFPEFEDIELVSPFVLYYDMGYDTSNKQEVHRYMLYINKGDEKHKDLYMNAIEGKLYKKGDKICFFNYLFKNNYIDKLSPKQCGGIK
ncbi:MAG: hypothetical protein QXK37_02255 [Candidatus Woesearchaeota archaeon]